MDEDVGIRITRLRRRLSVEQKEEVSSPATPTKKRTSKLVKPLLEDIVENAVRSPKRITRRSIALESTDADEVKVSTPGTRATRVKSNSSLLSENVQDFDSPRAKRATRRSSLAGSDTETAAVNTPTRRSRRVSQEFNKSPETAADVKIVVTRNKKNNTSKAQEVIVEEAIGGAVGALDENNEFSHEISSAPINNFHKEPTAPIPVAEESSLSEKSSPTNIRKSPRLSLKKNTSMSKISMEVENIHDDTISQVKVLEHEIHNSEEEFTKKPKVQKANKSLPTMGTKIFSGNKKRAKSLSKSDMTCKTDNTVYYSDNESRKIKSQKRRTQNSEEEAMVKSQTIGYHEKNLNIIASKSSSTPSKVDDNKENEGQKHVLENTSTINENNPNVSPQSSNVSLDSTHREGSITSVKKLDNFDAIKVKKSSISSMQPDNVCEDNKNAEISSTIFLEDPDSNDPNADTQILNLDQKLVEKNAENSVSKELSHAPNSQNDAAVTEDLYVNEGQNIKNKIEHMDAKNISNNEMDVIDCSCEPMDIDETLTEYSKLIVSNSKPSSSNTSLQSFKESKDLSDHSQSHKHDVSGGIYKNNKEKGNTEKSYDLEKTNNRHNRSVKLSKSDALKSKSFDVNMNKESIDSKNNSVSGGVSITPMKHKILQNIGVVTSTPVLEPSSNSTHIPVQKNNQNSFEDVSRKGKLNSKQSEKVKHSAKKEDSDNESDKESSESKSDGEENCTLIDDEAESAEDDYESGDSQDEAEREYAEQNEVPVGGDTLDSDDDIETDNSDYEKDSFIVSSDEEDNNLLSGSGDDLSLCDNELKMTTKSKNKYNKRKIKEQKQASREMFEARHGKKDTTLVSDDSIEPDILFLKKNKKRNRLRLDSSKETSDGKIYEDELEITIINNKSLNDKDPLFNLLPVKQEALETSAQNNTVLEPMEDVEIDQDGTIFANNETRNPLESFNVDDEMNDSESSDDGGIADKYNSLLNDLNNSKRQRKSKNKGLSVSEIKASQGDKNDSLLDKLNLTGSEKVKKIKKDKHPRLSDADAQSSLSVAKLDDKIQNKQKELQTEITDRKSFTEFNVSKEKKEGSILNNFSVTGSGKNKNKQVENDVYQLRHIDAESSFLYSKGNDVTDLKKTIKRKDLSFNECKSMKTKQDNSILDKLNLTASEKVKKSAKNFTQRPVNVDIESIQGIDQNESSSDTIDFKLLFTHDEDSNDTQNENEGGPSDVEELIPLKKSEAKINLLDDIALSGQTDIANVAYYEDNVGSDIEANLALKSKSPKSKEAKENTDNCFEKEDNIEETFPVTKEKYKKDQEGKKCSRNKGDTTKEEFQYAQEYTRKRKERDNDVATSSNSKVYVTSSKNKTKVKRLPPSIIDQLEDCPQNVYKEGMRAVTATSAFQVDAVKRRKNKPSLYLEDSIHLDSPSPTRSDREIIKMKKPKVLPSVPTASTSRVGFTSNFKVNVLKQEKRHDAKLAVGPHGETVNFKTQRLYGSNVKRIATEELCRKQKRLKITKF